jgi:protein-S-isoprenylcysteine O-methyltransferase Ste14
MTNATLTADTFVAPTGIRSITDPRLDRVVATVASLPFAYMLYYRLAYEGFDLPRVAMAINFALLIGTMVVRRPPVRVTPKPLYWATTFVATYWGFATLGLMDRGVAIAPTWVSHGAALASLVVSAGARISLGRNIGFVPAQRELVTSYAYGIVRHPIYTGLFLSLTGVMLRGWSPTNLVLVAVPAVLFVIKSFMEERFLAEDPAYRRYMDRVRCRWIPGIA